MSQTQSISENLEALRNELKSAAEKHDAEAKSTIRAALAHADAAKAQLKAQLSADDAKRKAQAQQTSADLDEVAKHAKAALDNTGTELRTHLNKTIASAKSAYESIHR